ncbi:MAG: 3-oxoacyl-ACP reductase FabG [Pseudomonadota bacterium]
MSDTGDVSQRPILVTGASKGIGAAIALRLGSLGFPVAAHFGKDQEGAAAVVGEIKAAGGMARSLSFDVADRDATRAVLEQEIAQYGSFWGVVLNAGITRDHAFAALEADDWDDVLQTNLDGFHHVLKPLVMPMIRRRDGGRVIVLSSVSGIMGNRGQVNYSAAKAGLIGASKALALELAKRRITVNCVAPGLIETAMTSDLPREEVLSMIPMRRFGSTEEVAAAVAFLASDDAAYITRQVISVNGGLC